MCNPAVAIIATTVISAAGAVYSAQQQNAAIKAANTAADTQYIEEVGRAERDAQDRENQLTAETLQEASRFQQQREQLALESLREQASARVASAESGLGGVSVARSFLANEIGEDLARSDIERSEDLTQFNIAQRGRGIATAKRDRQTNAQFTHASNSRRRLSSLDIGISAATAGVEGFNRSGGFSALSS